MERGPDALGRVVGLAACLGIRTFPPVFRVSDCASLQPAETVRHRQFGEFKPYTQNSNSQPPGIQVDESVPTANGTAAAAAAEDAVKGLPSLGPKPKGGAPKKEATATA